MTEKSGRDSPAFQIRLPGGMRDEIKIIAAKNRRSMNAEIICALDEWLSRVKEAA